LREDDDLKAKLEEKKKKKKLKSMPDSKLDPRVQVLALAIPRKL
jgi:hypothetical protein